MLFDDSAQQEAVSCRVSLAENGCSLLKRLNVVDDRLLLRPKGADPVNPLCVTGLEKGVPFPVVGALIGLIGVALNWQTT